MRRVVVFCAILGKYDGIAGSTRFIAEQKPVADAFIFGDTHGTGCAVFFGNIDAVTGIAAIFAIFRCTGIGPNQFVVLCFFANGMKGDALCGTGFGVVILQAFTEEIAFVWTGFVTSDTVFGCSGTYFGAAVGEFNSCVVFLAAYL